MSSVFCVCIFPNLGVAVSDALSLEYFRSYVSFIEVDTQAVELVARAAKSKKICVKEDISYVSDSELPVVNQMWIAAFLSSLPNLETIVLPCVDFTINLMRHSLWNIKYDRFNGSIVNHFIADIQKILGLAIDCTQNTNIAIGI